MPAVACRAGVDRQMSGMSAYLFAGVHILLAETVVGAVTRNALLINLSLSIRNLVAGMAT